MFETPIAAEDPVAERSTLKDAQVLFVGRFDSVLEKSREASEKIVANPYDGVFLPRWPFYKFLSSGEENPLVFRVGGFDAQDWMRIAPDGSLLYGHSVKSNHVEDVFAAGRSIEN